MSRPMQPVGSSPSLVGPTDPGGRDRYVSGVMVQPPCHYYLWLQSNWIISVQLLMFLFPSESRALQASHMLLEVKRFIQTAYPYWNRTHVRNIYRLRYRSTSDKNRAYRGLPRREWCGMCIRLIRIPIHSISNSSFFSSSNLYDKHEMIIRVVLNSLYVLAIATLRSSGRNIHLHRCPTPDVSIG